MKLISLNITALKRYNIIFGVNYRRPLRRTSVFLCRKGGEISCTK